MVLAKKNGVSEALGFSFACGRKPHAKLNRRTERVSTMVAANINICIVDSTVAANMSICIVDSDIGSVRPTEPWALAQHMRRFSPGIGPTLGPGRLGSLGPS